MRLRGGKLEIRKKLRRKPAGKNGLYVRMNPPFETEGEHPQEEEKKELRGRRVGINEVLVVRMKPLARTASGAPGQYGLVKQ
jgi:hypothetical protein